MGRDSWANIYAFYRVLSAKVTITWLNEQTSTITNGISNTAIVGFELTDDTTSLKTATRDAFLEGRQCHPLILPGHEYAPLNMRTQTYTYTPETWTYHVQEQGVEERWTLIGESPANLHDLTLRWYPF